MNDASVSITTLLFFFGSGLVSLFFGLIVQTGKMKRWWIIYSTPLAPIGWFYGAIPFSLVFFAWGFVMFIPNMEIRQKAFLCVSFFGFIPSIILTMFRPRWLVPPWLRWLEDNHRDILSILKKEATQMGGITWDRRVKTQEDLEEWVEEVRQKYGK